MSKVNSEIKVMIGVLRNMFINGTNDEEVTRMKNYISSLYQVDKLYLDNGIHGLKKRYMKLQVEENDIPKSVIKRANQKTKEIVDEITKGVSYD